MEFREPPSTKVSLWCWHTCRPSPERDWTGIVVVRTAITTTTTEHRIRFLIPSTDSESNTAKVRNPFRHMSISDNGLSSAFSSSTNAAKPTTG